MRILCLNRKPDSGETNELLEQCGHRVALITAYTDALEIVRSEDFDAVVIMGEDENPGILDFTSKVHRVRPDLPVFLANDWGAELLMGLHSLEMLEMPAEILQR